MMLLCGAVGGAFSRSLIWLLHLITGVLPLISDLSLILDLVAREMARKHTAFYNIGFSEAKALFRQKLARKWGHAIARGWASLLLDRLRDFVVVPSSAGGNSSFETGPEGPELVD